MEEILSMIHFKNLIIEIIMPTKTSSLARLLNREDIMTRNDILQLVWEKDGNIFSLLPKDCFVKRHWEVLLPEISAILLCGHVVLPNFKVIGNVD